MHNNISKNSVLYQTEQSLQKFLVFLLVLQKEQFSQLLELLLELHFQRYLARTSWDFK